MSTTPNPVIIALDAMGGDFGPAVVVPAALKALQFFPELHLILVGDETVVGEMLRKHHALNYPKLSIVHASQIVGMDEKPSQALRLKKDSSMRVAINLVKEGKAQACVSAGNTGALMATAKFVLKTLPGIDRPAIIAKLPTTKKNTKVRVLDLGANIDCTPQNLVEFAIMGSVVAKVIGNIPEPSVGLLNVGEEEVKGNDLVKDTSAILEKYSGINYIGYVEGDDIFKATADVVVCDGFVGNVMLKTTEGVLKMLTKYVKDAFTQNWFTKLSALAVMHVLKKIGKSLDPSEYNGASLLGLHGIVIKSHGSANQKSFLTAIREAVQEVEHNVPAKIQDGVAELLAANTSNISNPQSSEES
jgi:glycerol-3-phosphate acyltransferase PlsX